MKRLPMLAASCLIAWSAMASATPAKVDQHDAAVVSGSRSTVELRDGWQFRFGPSAQPDALPPESEAGWESVSVPHTWNRVGVYLKDVPAGTAAADLEDKRQGEAWYRLQFDTPRGGRAGERTWLEFDAASRVADVWLNGVHLGRHEGGFSRFRFDASAALKATGANELAVRVDNTPPAEGNATADTLPLTGDFFIYGGLYRPVRLVRTADVHFDMRDLGGPGVYATTISADKGSAMVDVRARVANASAAARAVAVQLRLLDAKGRVAATGQASLTIPAGATVDVSRTLRVARPRLWQGTSNPYLYRLEASVAEEGGARLDLLTQAVGIRTVRIDPERGLFLNGRHLALHGVGLHQDRQGMGWAMTDAAIADTVDTILDMGANTIRLTHYQHGPLIHELADRHGLVIWDEIPLVTAWTRTEEQVDTPSGLLANARQQLGELIRQNQNHASTVVWGIANEVDFGPTRPDFLGQPPESIPSPVALLQDLHAYAKAADPSRPTAIATCCLLRVVEGIPDVGNISDTLGANRYYGWYYGKPAELGPHLDALRAAYPSQPLSVTEYGAGGGLGIATDDPLGGPIDMGGFIQPEAYQTWLHVQTWPVIRDRPYLWASWLWNGFDFSSNVRREGDSVDINTKGLVYRDGALRKDAFHFYRANWSDKPTIHISGRRYADRAYDVTDVEVFSNAPVTTLSVNGKKMGKMRNCPDHRCVWQDVRLTPGDNSLVAEGKLQGRTVADRISWRLDPAQAGSLRIDSGTVVAAATSGPRYGSDAFFAGGEAASADKRPRGRPPVLAAIAGSDERDLLATYRKGRFGYSLPLRDGRYRVSLDFAEPFALAGERVFDVVADGKTMLPAVDVAELAGGALRAIRRSFEIDVSGGKLDLQFVPVKGDAIVSALAVEPVN